MTLFALKRPVTISMIAAGLCLLGVISWQRLPVQLLPEVILPEVYISGGIAGASPEKIERELVIPIEEEVATLDGVHDIESTASANFATVKVSFDRDTDMKFALLKLQQKMNRLQDRLSEDSRISVDRFDTADLSSFLMQLSLRGAAEVDVLREFANRRIRPKLEQVEGVVNVGIGGGREATIAVEIDPERCEAFGIPLVLVQQKINAFHREPEHLGRVISGERRVDITLLGRIGNLTDLRDLVIDPTIPVRLRDVATVSPSHADRTQLFRINGKASVGLFVQKDNSSNMLAVAQAVLARIEALQPELQPYDYEIVVNFSQAEQIQKAIDRVEQLAVTGAGLALVVLFLFLRNLRFVTILMLAIPVSLLVTFNLMYAGELSINILSLCGLALAIGMLVDNGIVVMENIFAHFQRGRPPATAALEGTREVSRSILAATVTTVLVFLPVLFIESEARLFVHELALAVIFPLVISLGVALTIIPLLASRSLKAGSFRRFGSGRILEIYRLVLKSAIRHRLRTFVIVISLFLISLFAGITFILRQAPPPPPERLDLFLTMARGTTLEASDAVVSRFEEQVLELPELQEVRANIRDEEANVAITFLPADERSQPLKLDKVREQLNQMSERIGNVELTFEQPRSGRRGGGDPLSSLLQTDEALRLRGHDLGQLRLLSEQLKETLRSHPDIRGRSIRSELRSGAPELQVRGDRLRLAMRGLSMQNVMQSIWATRAEGSAAATPFYDRAGEYDLQLQLKDVEERRLSDMAEVKVTTPNGQFVPLKEVASLRVDEGPHNIVRYNQERQVLLTYQFTDEVQSSKTRLQNAQSEVDRMVANLRLPRGFTLEKVEQENEQTVYYWMLAVGAILIYMFLAAQFESLFSPLVILGTVPTALIGALIVLVLSGTPLSLGQGAPMALLGLIVLLGIVVNNGIILIDRISVLRTVHGYRWQRAVMAAGQSRVRPILMTSATTILGIFPLALKQGTELELWPPFAITVLGGLSVSALSTLVFLPVLYVALEQTKAWLLRIGWVGIVAATMLAGAFLFWFQREYDSVLYTSLVALPAWFSLLALFYGWRWFREVQQQKTMVAEEIFTIRIRNLTKIYGAPSRFVREWQKHERRLASKMKTGEAPWTREQLLDQIILLAVLGAILFFLHTFFVSKLWLAITSLFSLIWLFTARHLWRRWRSVASSNADSMPHDGRWQKEHQEARPDASARGAGRLRRLLRVLGNSSFLFVALFLAYLHFRLQSPAITTIMIALAGLLYALTRTARQIGSGRIDPELPAGRLRKLKRIWYKAVLNIPILRPPRPQVVALKGVDLDIGAGMFGLLGPNGAGKTTLMRNIVGVLSANRGTVKINDRPLEEHREVFHGSIGYLPQDFGLYENMTPEEALNHHALINGIYDRESRGERIAMILRRVGLWERRQDKIGTFSGGMKQRVGIAQTLLHLPQIIVVDEPTAGLDPRERIRFRNLLAELAKDRIVIFSTHIVEDISSTCRDLAVLNDGQVLFRGTPEELQQRAQGKVYEASVPDSEFATWQSRLQIVQHNKIGELIKMRFVSDRPVTELAAVNVAPSLEDAYVLLLNNSKAKS